MVNATEVIVLSFAFMIAVSGLAVGAVIGMDGSKAESFVCNQSDPVKSVLELIPGVDCQFSDDPSTEPEDVYRLSHSISIDPVSGRLGLIRDNTFSYETEVMEGAESQFSFLSQNLGFFTAEEYKVEYRLINDSSGRILTTDSTTFTDEVIEGTEFKEVIFTTPNLPDGRYRIVYDATAVNEGLLGTSEPSDSLETDAFLVPGQDGVVG